MIILTHDNSLHTVIILNELIEKTGCGLYVYKFGGESTLLSTA